MTASNVHCDHQTRYARRQTTVVLGRNRHMQTKQTETHRRQSASVSRCR